MQTILARMTGDPALLKDQELTKIGSPTEKTAERHHELFLEAKFTSHVDLTKVNYGDNLGNEVFFCHRPDAHTLLPWPYVYSNGHEVPSGDNAEPTRLSDGKEGLLFSYYVFFRVSRDENGRPSKPPLESFDLRKNPEDVCFRLVGGAYRAFGYTSNTVEISKETILTALTAEFRR
jgi:hypothetical protein